MKERLLIIIVAIIAGVVLTSAGFFIYQSTKKVTDTQVVRISPTPVREEENKVFVRISEPSDEILTNKRTIVIKGSTNPENVVVISSNIEDVQVLPTQEGEFSATVSIDANANPIRIKAIAPNGAWAQEIRTVTFSTGEF